MKGHAYEPRAFGSHAPRPGTSARAVGAIAALVALAFAVWRAPFVVGVATVLAGVLAMHELGHYAAARAVGMKVTDFFLGFGPRLWSFRRGETTYGLRALPLGAYVRIIGMSSSDAVKPGDEHRAYRTKSYPRRLLVVCAGSLMHVAMALIALVLLHAAFGAPTPRWQVAEVTGPHDGAEHPAVAAGISPGDRIVSVNGIATEDWSVFKSEVQSRPGESVLLMIERDGALFGAETTLATDPDSGTGRLGIAAAQAMTYRTAGLPVAAGRAIVDVGRMIADSARGIWSLTANFGQVVDRIISPPGDRSGNDDLSSRPLSVVGIVDLAADNRWGWSERLTMFAAVNVFFGVFNMLPVPPFDGGHAAVATYERWRERGGRSRYLSDPRALTPIVVVVATVLVLLAIGLVYLDVANPVDL